LRLGAPVRGYWTKVLCAAMEYSARKAH
jgi:hypothetical protein